MILISNYSEHVFIYVQRVRIVTQTARKLHHATFHSSSKCSFSAQVKCILNYTGITGSKKCKAFGQSFSFESSRHRYCRSQQIKRTRVAQKSSCNFLKTFGLRLKAATVKLDIISKVIECLCP